MIRFILLAAEFCIVFAGLPLLIYYKILPNFPIPYLLLMALAAFLVLHYDPSFDSARLTNWPGIRPHLVPLLLRDAVFLAILGVGVRLFAPDLLFSLLRRAPVLWSAIMLLYPLLSVYPQELIYRAFLMHRYQALFGSGWALLVASALAFGFVHIIFGNWLAVGLCVIGGFLFSVTYQQSGSLLLACLDHALFGNFIFTIGLGKFFYHGTRM
ncbi:MAG TPA: CPBP family intramembrane glutamic endopeptidase [Candidatus Limnocylindrales bacterium]|nr:CPBP family intramembrane glutamic endopeptidase [Candidatus Limnocylindrales bacterium]